MKQFTYYVIIILFPIIISNGCRKAIEVPNPSNESISEIVFNSDVTANAAALGLYQRIYNLAISKDLSKFIGLYTDELVNYSTGLNDIALYGNDLISTNTVPYEVWSRFYQVIYHSNSLIEGVGKSDGLSLRVKDQIKGESLFFRAFSLFHLYNIFGNIPLPLSTSYAINSKLSRSDSQVVYAQIIDDLQNAETLVSNLYVGKDGITGSPERGRVCKPVVHALLAKVYLQQGNFSKAVEYSTLLLNNNAYTTITDLDQMFLKNNTEAILQLTVLPNNTTDGQFYILTTTPSSAKVSLTPAFVSLYSAIDKRRLRWIGQVTVAGNTFYFPYKYKVAVLNATSAEHVMVLRKGEQYLIRAEAFAKQGLLSEARTDLNYVRNRNGLPNTLAVTQHQLIDSIYQETRMEMFTEWMGGWLALKRNGRLDEIMTQVSSSKGGQWESYKSKFPIPQSEIDKNRNLLPQNEGY